MSNHPTSEALVRSIIGDLRVATSDEELAAMEIDDEDITEEELAEFDALPDYECTPEESARFVANGMKMVRYLLYKQEMKARGLPHIDRHEWMNMAVEPEVPA